MGLCVCGRVCVIRSICSYTSKFCNQNHKKVVVSGFQRSQSFLIVYNIAGKWAD